MAASFDKWALFDRALVAELGVSRSINYFHAKFSVTMSRLPRGQINRKAEALCQ